MELSGLHLLMSYQCTFECDHCFVWSSPWQEGTMSLAQVESILTEAEATGTIRSIYFEGGEPFLFYPILLAGVRRAAERGFSVGIVSNSYWATTEEDAVEWLRPLAGQIDDLSISSDLYHHSEKTSRLATNAAAAAKELGIPLGFISIAQPNAAATEASGQLPIGESAVLYRGRAAAKLAPQATKEPWAGFDSCPYENLRDPGRLHVDPLGNLHICQGLSIGNLFAEPLARICARYDPDAHPLIGPLLRGGPAALVRDFGAAHERDYADACHLCDDCRRKLRSQFPASLSPDQMYGSPD